MCCHWQNLSKNLSERFVNEDLGIHWRVDDSSESFQRLLEHIEKTTNFKPYFEQALANCELHKVPGGITVADIGAGVGWTSALMALHPDVERVYAIEPSQHRFDIITAVAKHFKVPEGKLSRVFGSFEDFKLREKMHMIVLCGSLHHCWDRDIPLLFRNIRAMLLEPPAGGIVLVANEHYVNSLWTAKRMMSWLKHFRHRASLFYGPGRWRAPYPFDGEHWRTRRELKAIFDREGFEAKFISHEGDLCKDKSLWVQRIGWTYYHAILSPKADFQGDVRK